MLVIYQDLLCGYYLIILYKVDIGFLISVLTLLDHKTNILFTNKYDLTFICVYFGAFYPKVRW